MSFVHIETTIRRSVPINENRSFDRKPHHSPAILIRSGPEFTINGNQANRIITTVASFEPEEGGVGRGGATTTIAPTTTSALPTVGPRKTIVPSPRPSSLSNLLAIALLLSVAASFAALFVDE